ncbi:MAG: cadherin repeat domain-containing protein, partial [Ekhidna sp.]|nr:cadherin repeat domain-containing protein [Ekhidna sp.]
QTFSVPEDAMNGTAVGTVQATDPEEDDLMFTITSGNTGDVFDINRTTGALTTAGALDFENNPNYTLTVKVSDGKLSVMADITVLAADFTVSSTNTTINVPGYANVYTVYVETTLTNWTITSSNNAIIPDAEIQKLGDKRFSMVVGEYPSTADNNSRAIMLTVSGTGGNEWTITVNQTKNMVNWTGSAPSETTFFNPNVGGVIRFGERMTPLTRSDYMNDIKMSVFNFTVGGTADSYTLSVSPAKSIRLRANNPIVVGDGVTTVHFNYLPPSGSVNTYAIITLTSNTDPTKKSQFVVVLRPPSGG